MTFRVGQKVVCVDDTPDWLGRELVIKKGEVYTIAELFTWRGTFGVRLVEVRTEQAPGWNAGRFRPAVEPKQEVSFTTGAPIDSERWDNRREPMPVVNVSQITLRFPLTEADVPARHEEYSGLRSGHDHD